MYIQTTNSAGQSHTNNLLLNNRLKRCVSAYLSKGCFLFLACNSLGPLIDPRVEIIVASDKQKQLQVKPVTFVSAISKQQQKIKIVQPSKSTSVLEIMHEDCGG